MDRRNKALIEIPTWEINHLWELIKIAEGMEFKEDVWNSLGVTAKDVTVPDEERGEGNFKILSAEESYKLPAVKEKLKVKMEEHLKPIQEFFKLPRQGRSDIETSFFLMLQGIHAVIDPSYKSSPNPPIYAIAERYGIELR